MQDHMENKCSSILDMGNCYKWGKENASGSPSYNEGLLDGNCFRLDSKLISCKLLVTKHLV